MSRISIMRKILLCITFVVNVTGNISDIRVKDQREVQIIEGGDINILCDISKYAGQQIYWESDDKVFHVDGNQLLLTAVTRNQAGSYGCYSRTEGRNDVIEQVNIDVLYPSKIISWDSPYTRLRQNDSYDTVVEIQGNPPPEHILLISDQKENVRYRAEGNGKINISINSVQCGDTGTYRLYAVNDINFDTLTKSIIVFCEPYVNPNVTTNFDMTPRLGETISLEMHAAGFPKPNFTWSYDGVKLEHTDEDYTSTVHLEDIHVDDFGTYRLDMENSVGKTTYYFRVIPSGPPEPPGNLTFISSTSYSATISWTPGYDYNSTQTFVIEDSESNVLHTFTEESNEIGNVTVRTLGHLMPGHFYNITLSARNKHGTCRESSHHKVSFYTQDITDSWAIILGVVASPFIIVFLCSFLKRIYENKRAKLKDQERKRLIDESTKHPRYDQKDKDYSGEEKRQSLHNGSDQVDGTTK